MILFAVAFALGLAAVAMLLRAGSLAKGYWEGPPPPGWHFAFITYQLSGFLALCFATAAVLSLAPISARFRPWVVSPLLARRPLSPACLLLLYPLGILVFALSYNVPLLGRVSEALEDGPVALAFYPFFAIGAETVLTPLANGFSGTASDRGEPYLAWLFFIALSTFAYLAARIVFWFVACIKGRTRHTPSERPDSAQHAHPTGTAKEPRR